MAVAIPDGNGAACKPLVWSRSGAITVMVSLQGVAPANRLTSLLNYMRLIARRGFGIWGARFSAQMRPRGENRRAGDRGNNSRVKWSYLKILIGNSDLQRKFDHGRVLFVQHPSEKAPSQAVRSGSFVACAEVLGNCDGATEGGIPRSSR
jgi:hypothetical protein